MLNNIMTLQSMLRVSQGHW